jgi:hypothetical protein
MVVRMSMLVFAPEDRSSMFLRNTGVYLQTHTVLQPRRSTLTYKLMILHLAVLSLRVLLQDT